MKGTGSADGKRRSGGKVISGIVTALFFSLYSLVLSFVGLETVVRLKRGKLLDTTHLSSQYWEPEGGRPKSRAEYDPELGWISRFGTIEHEGNEYTILEGNIRSNGRERPVDLRSDKTILAVGDSFTFGEEVSDHETWPARLEEILGARVINGGVMNYGFDQAVLMAERLVPRYRPDILILGFIPHDIRRCEQSFRLAAKPYFTLEEGRLSLRNTPVPLPEKKEPREMDAFRKVSGYSHFADLVMRRTNINYWLNIRIEVAEKKDHYVGAGNGSGPIIACALVERLAALEETHDVEIIILAQYTRHLGRRNRRIALDIVECAEQNSLAVVDVYERLASSRENDPEEFEGLFVTHMTARGNTLVAEELAEYFGRATLLE